MSTFDVYDMKNSERLLGSLKYIPPHRCDWFRIAVTDMGVFEWERDYSLPTISSVEPRVMDFKVEWRTLSKEIDTGSPWYKQQTVSRWAVLTTNAPLDLLMKCPEFTPAGSVRLDRRTIGVL